MGKKASWAKPLAEARGKRAATEAEIEKMEKAHERELQKRRREAEKAQKAEAEAERKAALAALPEVEAEFQAELNSLEVEAEQGAFGQLLASMIEHLRAMQRVGVKAREHRRLAKLAGVEVGRLKIPHRHERRGMVIRSILNQQWRGVAGLDPSEREQLLGTRLDAVEPATPESEDK